MYPGTLGQTISSRIILINTVNSAKLDALRLKQFAEFTYSDNVFTKCCRLIVPGYIYTDCTHVAFKLKMFCDNTIFPFTLILPQCIKNRLKDSWQNCLFFELFFIIISESVYLSKFRHFQSFVAQVQV